MSIEVSKTQVEQLMAQDLDDLFADLALADAGTHGPFGLSLESLSDTRGAMSAKSGATAAGMDGLFGLGRRIFNRVWPTVRGVVCALYAENDGDGEAKGWVTTVATAKLAATSVASPVAIIIAVIAMKMGLDQLCATDAEAAPA